MAPVSAAAAAAAAAQIRRVLNTRIDPTRRILTADDVTNCVTGSRCARTGKNAAVSRPAGEWRRAAENDD